MYNINVVFQKVHWSVSDSEYVTDGTVGLKCAISILEEGFISNSVCADLCYESYISKCKSRIPCFG